MVWRVADAREAFADHLITAPGNGTVNDTPVYPHEVLKRMLVARSTALILVHNHSSGDPKPSRDDYEVTRENQRAAGLLGWWCMST